MQIYEWKEIPASKYKPFFWGQPAMSFYPSLNKKLQSLNEKPDPNKVLGKWLISALTAFS